MSQDLSRAMSCIEVCHGPKCSDFGSRELSKALDALGIESRAGDCRSQCPHAPVIFMDEKMVTKATVEKVADRMQMAVGEQHDSKTES